MTNIRKNLKFFGDWNLILMSNRGKTISKSKLNCYLKTMIRGELKIKGD